MIHDNMEFHNVHELVPMKGDSGLRLQRYPEELRRSAGLNNRARFIANQAACCEIRLVAESYRVHLYLRADDATFPFLVFKGDFFVTAVTPEPGTVQCIPLDSTQVPRLSQVTTEALRGGRFSPDVWRVFCGRTEVRYHGVDAMGMALRPPEESEKPRRTLLAYGSSITMGAGSSDFFHGYAVQAARRLGMDIINLGLGGACHVEPQIADFIAARNDWDAAILELGVNMRGIYEPEEFRRRVEYMVGTIRRRRPEAHLFLVTVFPNFAEYWKDPDPEEKLTTERDLAYSDILRRIAASDSSGFLHLVEGGDILTDFTGLTADLIHPSDIGHVEMGINLADEIRPILDEAGVTAGKSSHG